MESVISRVSEGWGLSGKICDQLRAIEWRLKLGFGEATLAVGRVSKSELESELIERR
jgi:hypothetical protein